MNETLLGTCDNLGYCYCVECREPVAGHFEVWSRNGFARECRCEGCGRVLQPAYTLDLTPADVRTLDFVGGRYGWSAALLPHIDEDDNGSIRCEFAEPDAWEWRNAVDSDDALFPLLDPRSGLFKRLLALYESIV